MDPLQCGLSAMARIRVVRREDYGSENGGIQISGVGVPREFVRNRDGPPAVVVILQYLCVPCFEFVLCELAILWVWQKAKASLCAYMLALFDSRQHLRIRFISYCALIHVTMSVIHLIS